MPYAPHQEWRWPNVMYCTLGILEADVERANQVKILNYLTWCINWIQYCSSPWADFRVFSIMYIFLSVMALHVAKVLSLRCVTALYCMCRHFDLDRAPTYIVHENQLHEGWYDFLSKYRHLILFKCNILHKCYRLHFTWEHWASYTL